MLWMVFNIQWQQHMATAELYGDLSKLLGKIATRELALGIVMQSSLLIR